MKGGEERERGDKAIENVRLQTKDTSVERKQAPKHVCRESKGKEKRSEEAPKGVKHPHKKREVESSDKRDKWKRWT